MKKFLLPLIMSLIQEPIFAQLTPFERSQSKNVTATYSEVMDYYGRLSKKYDQARLLTCGLTDIGKPLHLLVLSRDKVFEPARIRSSNKRVLLINNGIHPGEPEGIDASMIFAREMLENNRLPANVVICIIPVYNIDGSLNRGESRPNQNGPESYGFRGNAQNLDLNRDFIKTDSRNSRSFQQIFTEWKPEIFIDNHTSNGADYQYVMTLIQPQKDKLNPVLSAFLTQTLEPSLYAGMKKAGFEMIPYVNEAGEKPESGIEGFLETPRYSTGYAALHNSIGFMPETHMLKSYEKRVYSTLEFMRQVTLIMQERSAEIGALKKEADQQVKDQQVFALNWELDRGASDPILFKGFEGKKKASGVSGADRLYYDRNEPFEKTIQYFNTFRPSVSVKKPIAYVIPQAWQKVIGLLRLNGVQMKQLATDTRIPVEMYYIMDYKSGPRPFEGHYLHSNVKVRTENQTLDFFAGDYIVYTDQPMNRYIMETLEPQGADSFFAWNFFDSVLGQKEHYSAYVFEDDAAELLKNDPGLREQLEKEKAGDPEMAKNAGAQLEWVYRHSKYYEKTYQRYPVGRLATTLKPELK